MARSLGHHNEHADRLDPGVFDAATTSYGRPVRHGEEQCATVRRAVSEAADHHERTR